MQNPRSLPSAIAAGIGLLVLVACGEVRGAAISTYPGDRHHGEQLATQCASCHASTTLKLGKPAISVPRLGGQGGPAMVDALIAYRSGARSNAMMRAVAMTLSDADIRDVAAYYSGGGLVPFLPKPAPDESSPGHLKVLARCAACHGETGLGEVAGVPIIGGQPADYLAHCLREYRQAKRSNPTMRQMARQLSREDIQQVTRYFESTGYLQAQPVPGGAQPAPGADDGVAVAEDAYRTPAQDTPSAVAASIALVDIPAGRYAMGSTEQSFQGGYPQHEVAVRGFRMARYDVTFDQYDAFARSTGRALPVDEGWGRGRRPVINLTMTEVRAFIAWLNRDTGRHFRLPTEAEWEYAVRAGTRSPYFWGDAPDPHYANTNTPDGKGVDRWVFTAPVGMFAPNPFGLFDAVGNVWQRVEDCLHFSYVGAPADGSAWREPQCSIHVVRGGDYGSKRRGIQSHTRGASADDQRSPSVGFRLAEDAA